MTQLLALEDVISIGELVNGCDRYVVQRFRAGSTLEDGFGARVESRGSGLHELVQCMQGRAMPSRYVR